MLHRLYVLFSFLSLLILCSIGLSAQSGQLGQYEIGNNFDYVFGVDLLNTFQINPKATGGENKFDLGAKLDFNYVKFDLKQIFEFRTLMDLNAQQIDKEDWKKNADRFEVSLKYGFKPRYGSKIYYSSDFSLRTQVLRSYTDDFIQQGDTRELMTSFLSPANITLSTGLEYRPEDSPTYFYFSPIALNVKYVNNDELANRWIVSREGKDLGTLHGNDLDKKTRTRVGAQAKIRFDGSSKDEKIFWDTYLDLFLAYSEFNSTSNTNPIQAEWVNSLSVRVWKPIVLSIDIRATYDPDLLFVDQENLGSFVDDKSYNMLNRILLSFSTKYFIGE